MDTFFKTISNDLRNTRHFPMFPNVGRRFRMCGKDGIDAKTFNDHEKKSSV
jgi:hypothetical protein